MVNLIRKWSAGNEVLPTAYDFVAWREVGMKLIVAIVQDVDAGKVMDALMAEGYRATKISSTGGFLVRGNTTILTGVPDEHIDTVLGILREHCQARREFVSPVLPLTEGAAARHWVEPLEVEIGGATVFLLDVERFEQV
jgi:uncharacterized protein YaaQ